jgi:hypothetical protein
VWESLARLDTFRQRFPAAPVELTNTVLIGALLVPLGRLDRRAAGHSSASGHVPRTAFGMLQVAKKDLERLRQLVQLVPRFADPNLPPRVARGIVHRPGFADALTWFEIYGDSPDLVEHWRQLKIQRHQPRELPATVDEGAPFRRRRRRRRRRGGRRGPGAE